MKKSEKILLGVLAVAVVFFIADTFFLGSDESGDSGSRKGSVLGVANESGGSSQRRVKRAGSAAFSPDAFKKWKRDPFLGAFTAELIDSLQGNIPYVLKAIAWRGNTAHVLINDEIYKLGVPKNGFLVSQVQDSMVVFSRNGERYLLTLGDKNE